MIFKKIHKLNMFIFSFTSKMGLVSKKLKAVSYKG